MLEIYICTVKTPQKIKSNVHWSSVHKTSSTRQQGDLKVIVYVLRHCLKSYLLPLRSKKTSQPFVQKATAAANIHKYLRLGFNGQYSFEHILTFLKVNMTLSLVRRIQWLPRLPVIFRSFPAYQLSA